VSVEVGVNRYILEGCNRCSTENLERRNEKSREDWEKITNGRQTYSQSVGGRRRCYTWSLRRRTTSQPNHHILQRRHRDGRGRAHKRRPPRRQPPERHVVSWRFPRSLAAHIDVKTLHENAGSANIPGTHELPLCRAEEEKRTLATCRARVLSTQDTL
jgi:hypothetical protein